MEFMRRVRIGAEVMLFHFFYFGGLNARSYSYGVKFDTGLVNTYVGFYDEETGEN